MNDREQAIAHNEKLYRHLELFMCVSKVLALLRYRFSFWDCQIF